MSKDSKIEWTESTWNPVTGCSKVSEGCRNCYALRDWLRLSANPKSVYYGRNFTDFQCHAERLGQPLRWSKPRRIFVNSMSDLFHESVPDEFILSVFSTMAQAPQHTFQILTKRAERMSSLLNRWKDEGLTLREGCGVKLPNVWLGVSVENQVTADERIPLLLRTPAAIHWISAEPLLGPVDIVPYVGGRAIECGFKRDESYLVGATIEKEGCLVCNKRTISYPALDWVVVGGESGPNARPMHPDWTYSLLDQCKATGTHFLFKQWGEWVSAGQNGFGTHAGRVTWIDSEGNYLEPPPEDENADCLTVKKVGKKVAGRLLGGDTYDNYPAKNN